MFKCDIFVAFAFVNFLHANTFIFLIINLIPIKNMFQNVYY